MQISMSTHLYRSLFNKEILLQYTICLKKVIDEWHGSKVMQNWWS